MPLRLSLSLRRVRLRWIEPGRPHRRLTIPNHKELAKGTLRAIIREAGLTVDPFGPLP
ncbi:MAG: type II toxin-antitoxin system HicA family toxin [Phycisphaerae bacterium]|nr:type II toxin-antitoxin system HicA family toxin [Phycisphaerae bacterium]